MGLLPRNCLVRFWDHWSCLPPHALCQQISEVYSHLGKEVCAFTHFITVVCGEYRLCFHFPPCLWDFVNLDHIPFSFLSTQQKASAFLIVFPCKLPASFSHPSCAFHGCINPPSRLRSPRALACSLLIADVSINWAEHMARCCWQDEPSEGGSG